MDDSREHRFRFTAVSDAKTPSPSTYAISEPERSTSSSVAREAEITRPIAGASSLQVANDRTRSRVKRGKSTSISAPDRSRTSSRPALTSLIDRTARPEHNRARSRQRAGNAIPGGSSRRTGDPLQSNDTSRSLIGRRMACRAVKDGQCATTSSRRFVSMAHSVAIAEEDRRWQAVTSSRTIVLHQRSQSRTASAGRTDRQVPSASTRTGSAPGAAISLRYCRQTAPHRTRSGTALLNARIVATISSGNFAGRMAQRTTPSQRRTGRGRKKADG